MVCGLSSLALGRPLLPQRHRIAVSPQPRPDGPRVTLGGRQPGVLAVEGVVPCQPIGNNPMGYVIAPDLNAADDAAIPIPSVRRDRDRHPLDQIGQAVARHAAERLAWFRGVDPLEPYAVLRVRAVQCSTRVAGLGSNGAPFDGCR